MMVRAAAAAALVTAASLAIAASECPESRFCALGREACVNRGKSANPAALERPAALDVCDVCFKGDDCPCRCPDWFWTPAAVALTSGPATRQTENNCGGPRRPPATYASGFVEVSHQPEPHPSSMAGLWLYRARPGSTGLFYDARRVLELADVCDLAAYLNVSWYDGRNYESKRRLFDHALPLLAAASVDTLAFTHHRDAHRNLRHRLWQELVVVEGGARAACPVSARLRLGDERRPCDCRTLVC